MIVFYLYPLDVNNLHNLLREIPKLFYITCHKSQIINLIRLFLTDYKFQKTLYLIYLLTLMRHLKNFFILRQQVKEKYAY